MRKVLIVVFFAMLNLSMSANALGYIDKPFNEYMAEQIHGLSGTTWEQFEIEMELREIYYNATEKLFLEYSSDKETIGANYKGPYERARVSTRMELEMLASYYGYGGNLSEHIDFEKKASIWRNLEGTPYIRGCWDKPKRTFSEFIAVLERFGCHYNPSTNKIEGLRFSDLYIMAEKFGYNGENLSDYVDESML